MDERLKRAASNNYSRHQVRDDHCWLRIVLVRGKWALSSKLCFLLVLRFFFLYVSTSIEHAEDNMAYSGQGALYNQEFSKRIRYAGLAGVFIIPSVIVIISAVAIYRARIEPPPPGTIRILIADIRDGKGENSTAVTETLLDTLHKFTAKYSDLEVRTLDKVIEC